MLTPFNIGILGQLCHRRKSTPVYLASHTSAFFFLLGSGCYFHDRERYAYRNTLITHQDTTPAMTSLQEKANAVKIAVSNTTTCTPGTVVTIKELLLADAEPASAAVLKTKATSRTSLKTATGRGQTSVTTEQLSAKEKTSLATHVINATIKSLTEALKPQLPATTSIPAEGDQCQPTGKPTGKRTLRRSLSAPCHQFNLDL